MRCYDKLVRRVHTNGIKLVHKQRLKMQLELKSLQADSEFTMSTCTGLFCATQGAPCAHEQRRFIESEGSSNEQLLTAELFDAHYIIPGGVPLTTTTTAASFHHLSANASDLQLSSNHTLLTPARMALSESLEQQNTSKQRQRLKRWTHSSAVAVADQLGQFRTFRATLSSRTPPSSATAR
jgi:hypothetical protein